MTSSLPAFDYYTLDTMPGSLPMGGFVPSTPVYAVRAESFMAPADQYERATIRNDISIDGSIAFTVDNVLSPYEAATIIRITERLGYRSEAPGIVTAPGMRMNKSVHWVSDESILGPIFARIESHLPREIDGLILTNRLSHRLNMYKYDCNDVFNRHIDGDWPGYGLSRDSQTMVEWQGDRSKLTMLLYLNGHEDGIQGGETKLYRPDGDVVSVAPKTGRALFFLHGHGRGSVVHEGARVLGTKSKYVARINVLYGTPQEC